jgi:nickel-dependent lactate racemase
MKNTEAKTTEIKKEKKSIPKKQTKISIFKQMQENFTPEEKAKIQRHFTDFKMHCHMAPKETELLREDIEEAGLICPVDFILNVVLDEHKNIAKVVCGDPVLAHREGTRFLDRLYTNEIDAQADIVIVSQGGAPKDLNLYQTQKALDNSKHAIADGGTVILIGACNEGMGSAKFEEWLVGAEKPHDMVERIGRDFQLGGHKAAAIGLVLDRARIDLVSEMDDDFVRSIFMEPKPSAQAAFDEAMEHYGPDATVIAMPFGGATLPIVED